MLMMSVPKEFEWSSIPYQQLNALPLEEKQKYLKKEDVNIRQSLGEAVPTIIFQQIAHKIKEKAAEKELTKRYKESGRKKEISQALRKLKEEFEKKNPTIPKDLCWLEGENMESYLHDVKVCQEFAHLNRELMALIILDKLSLESIESFETIHNYIDLKTRIIRKGAVSAKEGEKLIIPMNMRDGALICIGKGNPDWNCSAPHGAGRLMSRSKARQLLDLDEVKKSMKGIDTWSLDFKTIDEAPQAYKPMEEIIENIKDTVEIIEVIKPVYNFKASE
jgi:RNA-splicing ligase RtcB